MTEAKPYPDRAPPAARARVPFLAWARQVGWPSALLITLSNKLPDRVLRLGRGEVIGADLLGPMDSAKANDDLEIRWATSEEIAALNTPGFYWDTRDRIGAENLRCAIAMTPDGEMAGYELFRIGWYQSAHSPVRVVLRPNQVWAVYAYVPPKFRGRRLAVDLADFARVRLLEEGYRYLYGVVRLGNKPAYAAHKLRGFKPVFKANCTRFLGLTFLRIDGRLRIQFTGLRGAIPLDLPTPGD